MGFATPYDFPKLLVVVWIESGAINLSTTLKAAGIFREIIANDDHHDAKFISLLLGECGCFFEGHGIGRLVFERADAL